MSEPQLMCPQCGRLFPCHLCQDSLLPDHAPGDRAASPRDRTPCLGSLQHGRNPESDVRPLWSGDPNPHLPAKGDSP